MNRILFLFLLVVVACKKTPDITETLYFPPIGSQTWETVSPASLGWNTSTITDLSTFLSQKNTRAFIILVNGKIAVEQYYGIELTGSRSFGSSSLWYWASAGKSLTSFLTGIAQQEGLINIENKTSDYIGKGWTSMPAAKEDLIKVKHQLTMTTGLDYNVADVDCTDPSCLVYKADAGTQWYYHNAPYTLLESVISSAYAGTYNSYTDTRIESRTGMSGTWIKSGFNNVYYSTARDAARFGLLILNRGSWDSDKIMTDQTYFNSMVSTSQNLNPSYGYLFWLNGKSSIIYPGLPSSFSIPLSPDAPADMFAAIGKNGQFIDIIPSLNMVVVRMGEAPDASQVPITFHNEMWQKIKLVIN
ncbi:MAG: serine hydrolase [Bacteroidia bacterium]|nr:serine hydrolase [Bacteroidia bacterium]